MSAEPNSQRPSPQQAERDRSARVQLARAAGLALLHISAGLEAGTLVQHGAGPLTLVKVGFAARGRRLLRAAYMLLDNDHAPEGVAHLRTMSEYVIVGRWIAKDPETRLRIWTFDDVRRTLLIDDKAVEHGDFRLMDDQTRAFFDEAKASLTATTPDEPAERAAVGKPDRLPSVEEMAGDVGLSLAYNIAYRIDSQSGVHAAGMAINNVYDSVAEGNLVRLVPHVTLGVDSYGFGASILLDLLSDADSVIPELGWTRHLELVQTTLQATSAADPDSVSSKTAAAES